MKIENISKETYLIIVTSDALKKQWIYNPEAVAVLEAYIEKNEGNIIPNFGYNAWRTINQNNSPNPMDWKRVRVK